MATTKTVLCQSVNSVQKTQSVQKVLSPALPAKLDIRLTLRKLYVVCRIVNRHNNDITSVKYRRKFESTNESLLVRNKSLKKLDLNF